MSDTDLFDDPNHRVSEELAFFAERENRKGNHTYARQLWGKAAYAEFEVARKATTPEWTTVFATSVVTGLVNAHQWDLADSAIEEFIDKCTPEGRAILRAEQCANITRREEK